MSKIARLVELCRVKHTAKGVVTLDLEIAPRGTMRRIKVMQTPDLLLAECIVKFVSDRARFPITVLGLNTSYSFTFH